MKFSPAAAAVLGRTLNPTIAVWSSPLWKSSRAFDLRSEGSSNWNYLSSRKGTSWRGTKPDLFWFKKVIWSEEIKKRPVAGPPLKIKHSTVQWSNLNSVKGDQSEFYQFIPVWCSGMLVYVATIKRKQILVRLRCAYNPQTKEKEGKAQTTVNCKQY